MTLAGESYVVFGIAPPTLEEFEAEVLALTNEFRAANGIEPLENDARLNAAAEDWSQTMAEDDFVAHSTPEQVEMEQGYSPSTWGRTSPTATRPLKASWTAGSTAPAIAPTC